MNVNKTLCYFGHPKNIMKVNKTYVVLDILMTRP